jgi:hypothetical protein
MATTPELLSHQLSKETITPIIVIIVGLAFAALGWFIRKWILKVEEDIKNRVSLELCEKEHGFQQQRRITDETQIKIILDELRILEKKYDDHVAWHLAQRGE